MGYHANEVCNSSGGAQDPSGEETHGDAGDDGGNAFATDGLGCIPDVGKGPSSPSEEPQYVFPEFANPGCGLRWRLAQLLQFGCYLRFPLLIHAFYLVHDGFQFL